MQSTNRDAHDLYPLFTTQGLSLPVIYGPMAFDHILLSPWIMTWLKKSVNGLALVLRGVALRKLLYHQGTDLYMGHSVDVLNLWIWGQLERSWSLHA